MVVLKTNWQVCERNGVMSTETGSCLAKEESLAKAKRTENETGWRDFRGRIVRLW